MQEIMGKNTQALDIPFNPEYNDLVFTKQYNLFDDSFKRKKETKAMTPDDLRESQANQIVELIFKNDGNADMAPRIVATLYKEGSDSYNLLLELINSILKGGD